MHSSTSNSKWINYPRVGLRASLALCLLLVLLSLGLEAVFRLGMPRISRIERLLEEEYDGALRSGKVPTSGLQALVLGNSLLDAGIRFEEAGHLLTPDIDARRWMVANTDYNDWYYGLRRLFAEGSRPEAVILMLTPRQLATSTIRGNYFQ